MDYYLDVFKVNMHNQLQGIMILILIVKRGPGEIRVDNWAAHMLVTKPNFTYQSIESNHHHLRATVAKTRHLELWLNLYVLLFWWGLGKIVTML